MRNKRPVTSLLVAMMGLLANPVHADEQLIPIVVSGDWAALEHRDSITSPPDVCLLMNTYQGVALRAAASGLEVRVSDEKWSLPTGVTGSVQLKVGDVVKSFDIDANTDTMVNATVSVADVLKLFGAMDTSSSMILSVGKAKPKLVSLNGSSRATNAFRTCAGLAGNDKKGGENPFQ